MPGTILLIEDDKGLQRVISLMLRQAGYLVTSVQTGEKALELITAGLSSDQEFDLLITDIRVPGENGPKFLEKLVNFQIKIPVMVISGYADEALAADLKAKGCCALLNKPFEAQQLMDCIHARF